MNIQIRHIVVLFFLVMSFVPFLLLTDLFPFMRFGMFAETVKSTPQRELFSLHIALPDGSIQALSERQIGLDDSHLNYLARTYYYTERLDFFTTHLKQSGLLKEGERLVLIHRTLTGNQWKQDTLFNQ